MIRELVLSAAIALMAPSATAQDAAAGAALFQKNCAYCHGEGAAGDGPLAGAMAIKPRNLTTLAKDNDGVFPTEAVVMRIDGRRPLVSHGSPMPVFGPYFEGAEAMVKSETGQPILTSRPIADLVAWLQSIQD
jgi:mono/diheme cytochrome c family protein